VLEEAMLDVMYETPSQEGVEQVQITEDVVLRNSPPIVTLSRESKRKGA
jgi:ATP-dependent Clp protease ATP-binding subunit ClpX